MGLVDRGVQRLRSCKRSRLPCVRSQPHTYPAPGVPDQLSPLSVHFPLASFEWDSLVPTGTFQQDLSLTSLPHSRGSVLYPFIVFQVESDKDPGFPNIERRSACATRTCLKLQQHF